MRGPGKPTHPARRPRARTAPAPAAPARPQSSPAPCRPAAAASGAVARRRCASPSARYRPRPDRRGWNAPKQNGRARWGRLASPRPRAQRRRSAPRAPPRCRRCGPARGARIRIVPPAAAAVRLRWLFTQANGYSSWKKNTKAGTSARSAQLTQDSRTISETRSKSPRSRLRDQRRDMGGVVLDIGVREQDQLGVARRRDALRHRPELAAPSLGTRRALDHGQPIVGETARDGASAVAAAVVHQDDPQRGVILRQQRGERASITGASSRAGTTTTTGVRPRPGHAPSDAVGLLAIGHAGASTGPACQKRPWPASR